MSADDVINAYDNMLAAARADRDALAARVRELEGALRGLMVEVDENPSVMDVDKARVDAARDALGSLPTCAETDDAYREHLARENERAYLRAITKEHAETRVEVDALKAEVARLTEQVKRDEPKLRDYDAVTNHQADVEEERDALRSRLSAVEALVREACVIYDTYEDARHASLRLDWYARATRLLANLPPSPPPEGGPPEEPYATLAEIDEALDGRCYPNRDGSTDDAVHARLVAVSQYVNALKAERAWNDDVHRELNLPRGDRITLAVIAKQTNAGAVRGGLVSPSSPNTSPLARIGERCWADEERRAEQTARVAENLAAATTPTGGADAPRESNE